MKFKKNENEKIEISEQRDVVIATVSVDNLKQELEGITEQRRRLDAREAEINAYLDGIKKAKLI